MEKRENVESKIKNPLEEGPLVALYFTVGISFLKEEIDKMSNEEITEIFSKLLHPDRVRNNVDYIYNALND
jgi:hypothetical protein